MKWIGLLITLVVIFSVCGPLYAFGEEETAFSGNLTYELVWADEFTADGEPDEALWDYDVGGDGWGNHELQYYTSGENVSIQDGQLVIELRREEEGSRKYTSTRLVTRGKGDWLYCKVEVRAKLPSGVGTWPAVWMLPTDWAYGPWPFSGEIDIMEHVGFDPNVIVQSVHTARNHGGEALSSRNWVAEVCEEYHIYAMEWLPDRIIFTVDGEVTGMYAPDLGADPEVSEIWPFDRRMHLLINLAFGGDWGGAMGTDESCLPARMTVDYVRVYQSPEIMEQTGQKD